MHPSIQLAILVVLMFLSAFFSSAETALTSVNKITLMSLADEGNKRAKLVLKIKDNTPKMLSAILIGNNIVNISASSLATTLAIEVSGQAMVGVFTGILTIVVLIFGEITPKTLATVHAMKFAMLYAPVINFLMFVLTPVIIIINVMANCVIALFGGKGKNVASTYTESELRTIMSVSHEEGIIESEEKDIINNLFDFGDALAKDVMIPRIDMSSISVDSTYYEILSMFRQEKYTRYPVYEDSADNVIGLINVKDLLLYDQYTTFNVRDIMREPYYTYEFKNVSLLMNELKDTSNNIAIVLDEYGSTVGMITLEDLLEEIVGEIKDEYDEDEEDLFVKVDEHTYLTDGTTRLTDINDIFATHLESDDYDSIAGYIIESLDKLPDENDSVTIDNVTFTVKTMDKNRIDTVEILILDEDKNNLEEN